MSKLTIELEHGRVAVFVDGEKVPGISGVQLTALTGGPYNPDLVRLTARSHNPKVSQLLKDIHKVPAPHPGSIRHKPRGSTTVIKTAKGQLGFDASLAVVTQQDINDLFVAGTVTNAT